MNISNMADTSVPVKRLRLSPVTGTLVESKPPPLFLKGPVPLDWISAAAKLPGKALAVGIALWWLEGMAKGGGVKVTQTALNALNVSRDACYDGLKRLEEAKLITVIREPGKRPYVRIVRKSPENPPRMVTLPSKNVSLAEWLNSPSFRNQLVEEFRRMRERLQVGV
jgi:hypothetical protein